MGELYVDVRVCNLNDRRKCETVENVLVDTGSTHSFLPPAVLKAIGFHPTMEGEAEIGGGAIMTYKAGTVSMRLGGRRGDAVVAAAKVGETPVIGATALENLGLMPDLIGQTLIRRPTLRRGLRIAKSVGVAPKATSKR